MTPASLALLLLSLLHTACAEPLAEAANEKPPPALDSGPPLVVPPPQVVEVEVEPPPALVLEAKAQKAIDTVDAMIALLGTPEAGEAVAQPLPALDVRPETGAP